MKENKNFTYNPKLDFKMLTYLYYEKNEYFDFKKIFFEGKEPETFAQRHLKDSMDIQSQMRKSEELNLELFVTLSQVYKDCELEEERITLFLEKYEMKKIELASSYALACWAFIHINNQQTFQNHSKDFSVMVLNWILVKNGFLPLLIAPRLLEKIILLAQRNITLNGLMEVLQEAVCLSQDLNMQYPPLSKKELMDILLKDKENLQELFFIQRISLNGSFAREEQTEYSDIDLAIETFERKKIDLDEVKYYLRNKLGREVDFVVNQNIKSLEDETPNFFFGKELLWEC